MDKKITCSNFRALFLLIFLFCSLGWTFGQAPITDNVPGANKPFFVPADVTHVNIAAWGGGGGGGGASTNNRGGNGGGGGGSASGQYAVSAGNTFTYTVGAGGVSGAANGGTGGTGNPSSVVSSLLGVNLTGNPGHGGQANRTAITPPNSDGGSASGGTISAGSPGTVDNSINNRSGAGGNSGTAFGSSGNGAAGVQATNKGDDGNIPGGGGSGGRKGGNGTSNQAGGAGANGQVMFDFISVSSVSPSSVCVGGTITITGTNFNTGTTTVTINGTACTSVTVVNATTITAVVAAGTTSGKVDVINNGRRNNGQNITVNPAPVITSQPVAVSICTNGTGTFSVTATGATTYQWMRNGVNLANDATYSGVNNATLTITNPTIAIAGNFSVAVGNGTCSTTSSAAALTVNAAPVAPVSPVPANSASGVCYAGTGAVTAISWGAVAGATSYDVYFGAGSLPATVTANVATNSYNTGALLANTTYYWRVVAKNGCGAVSSATFTFTTSATPCYCTADIASGTDPSKAYISMVSFRGALNQAVIDNPSTYSTTPRGYQDFSSLMPRPVQAQGNGLNVFINTVNTVNANKASYVKVWVDWNRNGNFDDPGETIFNILDVQFVSTTIGIAIPANTPPGDYRMRIRINNGSEVYTSCNTLTSYGETEDYMFTVIANCSAIVTATTDATRCGTGSVTLSAVASGSPTEFRWYATPTGGSPIAITATGSWTTHSISTNTTFYVAAFNGCESLVRIPVKAVIKQTPDITFTPGSAVACGDSSIIAISAAGDKEVDYFIDEKFEGGGLGVFTNQNILSTGNDSKTMWQSRTSVYVPPVVPKASVWFPAIASGVAGSKFVMATSDVGTGNYENALVSPVINTSTYSNLTFQFRMYYSSYRNDPALDYVSIEASTDGGTNYTIIRKIASSIGQGNDFATITITPAELLTYENKPSVRLRIRYRCNWGDGVAVDDVQFYGERPLAPSFVWTGTPVDIYSDAAATIPYANQPISRIYIKPSLAQLEANKTFVLSATATLVNGCSAVGNITVNNNNNISSAASTDWATATAWLPSKTLPDITKCVIVKTPVTIKGNANFEAFNVLVLPSGILNINDDPTKLASLKIQNELTNRGPATAVTVNSGGSLIQVNDNAANSGSITVKRNINVSADRKQYNYLISPVVGANLKTNIYRDGSGNPVSSPSVQYYIEGTNYFGESSGAYIAGRGLAVKEPLTGSGPFYAVFAGPPTNGEVTYNATNSAPSVIGPGVASRGYNLIGNPYPSNMDLLTFYTGNGGEAGGLSSTFRFWDNHNNITYEQQGSNYSGNSYSSYNVVSATGTAATSDAGTAGSSKKTPGRYVSVGQGFVTRIIGVPSKTLKFFNNSRTKEFENDSFFGKGAGSEMDRYWLKMVTPDHLAVQMAVVYFEGGSNGFGADDSFSGGGSDELYSMIDGMKIGINGRSPFVASDKVLLGSKHYVAGNYTIAIDQSEGIFASGQNIYLKDNQTGTITNLSEGSYTFSANAGETTGRFEIIYEPQIVLATDGKTKESLVVYRDGTDFVVKSQNQEITGLEVYDGTGRLLLKTAPNSTKAAIDSAILVNGVYVLKIDQHGKITTKKLIK